MLQPYEPALCAELLRSIDRTQIFKGKEEIFLNKSTQKYSSLEQLPLMLHCEDIAEVLGVSQQNAYGLMHAADFP
jgi:hypothetical protein